MYSRALFLLGGRVLFVAVLELAELVLVLRLNAALDAVLGVGRLGLDQAIDNRAWETD